MHRWLAALSIAVTLACSRTMLDSPDLGLDRCAGCKSACVDQKCVAIAQIAAAAQHTCARLETGEVFCWGSNHVGILGTGRTDELPHPTPAPIVEAGNVLEIAVSDTHACARHAGGVTCWGSNDYGQLGHVGGSLAPSRVPDLTDVADVAVGPSYSCAASNAGTVWCWGDDTFGQLGDRALLHRSPTPQMILLPSHVTSLALGYDHACAVTDGSEVWCWGANQFGQLGLGPASPDPHPPTKVALLAFVGTASAGQEVTCVTRRGGVLSCWGGGASYPTDTRNAIDVIGVAVSQSKTACVLKGTGSVECGLLAPDLKLGGLTFDGQSALDGGATSVAAGSQHGCSLLANGMAMCWGDNASGQLGDGTTESRAAPGQVTF